MECSAVWLDNHISYYEMIGVRKSLQFYGFFIDQWSILIWVGLVQFNLTAHHFGIYIYFFFHILNPYLMW